MAAPPTTSLTAVVGRVFWMMVGPLSLVLTLYFIVSSGTGWRTFADLLYFLVLGGMVFGRYLEVRAGNPMKSDGDPATPADFRRYVLMVAVIGPLLWVIANLIGNHLLAA